MISNRVTTAPISPPAVEESRRISAGESRKTGDNWLPVITLTVTGGLLVSALAHAASRSGAGWASLAFWLGLLLIYAPASLRLTRSGVGYYLPKPA